MEDLIWDAVPAQRTKKEEQFTSPVVTISALTKVGAGRKFTFNKAAQELLGIVGEDRVSFGFQPSTQSIFLKKATGDAGFKLTKTCTLSDKRTYEFITKMLQLNNGIENHFSLTASEVAQGAVQMILMDTAVITEEPTLEFNTHDLGAVSDEMETATFNDIAPEAEAVIEEEIEEMPEPEVEEAIEVEESTEEDVW